MMCSCNRCGRKAPQYSKTCPHCGATNTLIPEMMPMLIEQRKELDDCTSRPRNSYSTGFPSLDAVLPPGFIESCLYLLAAWTGTGKTTFLLQTANYFIVKHSLRVLYVAGEMSTEGIRMMRKQYGLTGPAPDITHDCAISKVLEKVRQGGYKVLIIDSLQTMSSSNSGRTSYEEQADISIMLKNIAHELNIIVLIVTQVNRDLKPQGSTAVLHNVDVVLNMARGHNGEVIVSAPYKNRQGFKAADRAVFRRTASGLIEKEEIETGHLLRHQNAFALGLAAAPVFHDTDYTTDEFTAVPKITKPRGLKIHGAKSTDNTFLSGVISEQFPDIITDVAVRANLLDRYDRGADVAVLMAILSRVYEVQLPVNVAYIGSIDSDGNLLMVPEIERRVKRAKDQGYSIVFGPMAVGSMKANWNECHTIHDVVSGLNLSLPTLFP